MDAHLCVQLAKIGTVAAVLARRETEQTGHSFEAREAASDKQNVVAMGQRDGERAEEGLLRSRNRGLFDFHKVGRVLGAEPA
jgi:hypothetical protein